MLLCLWYVLVLFSSWGSCSPPASVGACSARCGCRSVLGWFCVVARAPGHRAAPPGTCAVLWGLCRVQPTSLIMTKHWARFLKNTPILMHPSGQDMHDTSVVHTMPFSLEGLRVKIACGGYPVCVFGCDVLERNYWNGSCMPRGATSTRTLVTWLTFFLKGRAIFLNVFYISNRVAFRVYRDRGLFPPGCAFWTCAFNNVSLWPLASLCSSPLTLCLSLQTSVLNTPQPHLKFPAYQLLSSRRIHLSC